MKSKTTKSEKNRRKLHQQTRAGATAILKKNHGPKKKIEKQKKTGNTSIVTKEIEFARSLASNDKKIRDKVLKALKKWLSLRSQSSHTFTEDDFTRLWKGLFYSMWLSDKPLVQEELAESLSKIVHCFESMNHALLYTKCTFKSLSKEWGGLDRYRMDKFEMLVRRILRQTFEVCKKSSWSKKWVQGMTKIVEEILMDPKTSLGFGLHITEIYLEELAKVSQGDISKGMVTEFVRPFVVHLSTISDIRQIKSIMKHIFKYLILQSDVGMNYTEKFGAWRNAGFPCPNIDQMELVEAEENDDDENELKEVPGMDKPLDPRAGKVNVEIPQMPLDAKEISDLLVQHKFNEKSSTTCRKHISKLIEQFNELAEDKMPIGIKEIEKPTALRIDADEAAEDLLNFEKDLYADSSKNLNLRKRKLPEMIDLTAEESEGARKNDHELKSGVKKLKNKVKSPKKGLKLADSKRSKNKLKASAKAKEIPAVKGESSSDKWDVEAISPRVVLKNHIEKQVEPKLKRKKSSLEPEEPHLVPVLTRLEEQKKASPKKSPSRTEQQKKVSPKKLLSSPVEEKKASPKQVGKGSPTAVNSLTPKQATKSSPSKSPKVLNPLASKQVAKSSSPKSASPKVINPLAKSFGELPKTPKSQIETASLLSARTDSAKKRVTIQLKNNTEQHTFEYIRQLKRSPAIPYDANRKPLPGVLKPSPLPSPINPFYKRRLL